MSIAMALAGTAVLIWLHSKTGSLWAVAAWGLGSLYGALATWVTLCR